MEVLLHCYFDTFNRLKRDSLHARYKRREMVEYFNTMIEGCCRGEGHSPQKSVREAVLGIIRYHETMKNTNGGVCLMGKYHNILYVAVKLCYDWQLKDTGIVAALLESIYSCEKSFERIFVGAIFGTRAPHFISGWKSDFEDQEDNLRAVVYFIDHATTAGLEFRYGTPESEIRFIDVPLENCGKATAARILVQLGIPDKLHILLRFGARISPTLGPDTLLEDLLIRLLEFTNHVYPYNIVACLQIVLRVVPSIKFPEGIDSSILLEKHMQLVEDGVLPARRCGIEPPELKHLCRCVIRERLWQNSQLPCGIRQLPIPRPLRRYLDVLED